MTTFTFNVIDYKQHYPEYINLIDSSNVILAKEPYYNVELSSIFSGLIETAYIINDPIKNALLNGVQSFELTSDLQTASNYIIQIGVSNVWGTNTFDFFIEDVENKFPIH